MNIPITDIPETSWIFANIKHAGFYRVNYDNENWLLLIEQLNKDPKVFIDPTSRAQLIDDSFNLAREEIITQLIYFNIISYLTKENDPLPFQAAQYGLDYVDDQLALDVDQYKLFKVIHLIF